MLNYSDIHQEIRRIILNYPRSLYQSPLLKRMSTMKQSINNQWMPEALDITLIPRPWWRVVRESLPSLDDDWQMQSSRRKDLNMQNVSAADTMHMRMIDVMEMVLERVLPMEEVHLQFIASVQYPSNSSRTSLEEDSHAVDAVVEYSRECAESILILNKLTMIHPGWTAGLSLYTEVALNHPLAVMAIYTAISNDPMHDHTAFLDGPDCPWANETNKWICAFHPTTYCEIPLNLTTCHSDGCVQHMYEPSHMFFSTFFTEATSKGIPLPSREQNSKRFDEIISRTKQIQPQQHTEKQQRLFEEYCNDHQSTHYFKLLLSKNELEHYLTHNHSFVFDDMASSNTGTEGIDNKKSMKMQSLPIGSKESVQSHWQHDPKVFLKERLKVIESEEIWRLNYIDHFLLRPNSFYRELIQTMLVNFTMSVGVNFLLPYQTRVLPQGHHYHGLPAAEEYAGQSHQQPSVYDAISALPHGRCVTAHIRRGDRIPRHDTTGEEIDGDLYCDQHPDDGDKGCFDRTWSIPFYRLTLLDYLRKAESLIDIPTHSSFHNDSVRPHHHHQEVHYLFVNTDERPWLMKQIEQFEKIPLQERQERFQIYANWSILYFPMDHDDTILENYSKRSSEESSLFRRRGGTKSGVYFFAALEMMRSCEAFVGHFHSALSNFFYKMMCIRHRELRHVCPPKYDFHLGDYL
jgi:hypothetical protein